MKIFAVVLASLLSVPAFADSPLRLCARYGVWLKSGEEGLRELNRYVLKDYLIDRSRPGHEKMIFELPADLVAGKRVPVTLTVRAQEGNTRELTGPMGAATCEGPWAAMKCNFKFRDIAVKPSDSAWWLTKQHGNTPKRDGLLEIATRFSGDPIGFASTATLDESCR